MSRHACPSYFAFDDPERQELLNLPYAITGAHPTEMVNWGDCTALSGHHGLRLPTCDEWEYACRAETTTAYSCGPEPEDLHGFGNVLDESGVAANITFSASIDFDDGYAYHAPVGSYRSNPWGLFDMHGNLYEWCADTYGESTRIACGGSFHYGALSARSANREFGPAPIRTFVVGARFARDVVVSEDG